MMKLEKQNHRTGSRHWQRVALRLLAFLFGLSASSACSENELEKNFPAEAISPLAICLNTRATSPSGDLVAYPGNQLMGEQHTTQVRLYLFEGIGNEATYLGVMEDIGWKTHFGNQLPSHTASMHYGLKYKGLQIEKSYTLLGIGLNEEAQAAFDFDLQPATATQRATTLKEAQGRLLAQQTSQHIRRSEIYIGTAPYLPKQPAATQLTLYRRVAGVKGYFTNVPAQASRIRIQLYTAQNTALPLLQRPQKPQFTDYVPLPATDAAAQTLVEIPVPPGTLPHQVLSGGSYVLPIPAPPHREQFTLRIEVVGAGGEVLKTLRAKLSTGDALDQGPTGGGTGIIDSESAFRFPIIANHYYGIGRPDQPIDLRGN